MSNEDDKWLEQARRDLEPYFDRLADGGTQIVPFAKTKRFSEPDPREVDRARALMAEAAAGDRPKRAPLDAAMELDGRYTIVDGKATHAVLESMRVSAVPLIVVVGRES